MAVRDTGGGFSDSRERSSLSVQLRSDVPGREEPRGRGRVGERAIPTLWSRGSRPLAPSRIRSPQTPKARRRNISGGRGGGGRPECGWQEDSLRKNQRRKRARRFLRRCALTQRVAKSRRCFTWNARSNVEGGEPKGGHVSRETGGGHVHECSPRLVYNRESSSPIRRSDAHGPGGGLRPLARARRGHARAGARRGPRPGLPGDSARGAGRRHLLPRGATPDPAVRRHAGTFRGRGHRRDGRD